MICGAARGVRHSETGRALCARVVQCAVPGRSAQLWSALLSLAEHSAQPNATPIADHRSLNESWDADQPITDYFLQVERAGPNFQAAPLPFNIQAS